MMPRTLLLALVAPLACAQLQVYKVTGTTEEPLGTFYDMGRAVAGETLLLDLRVRNHGASAVQVTAFRADGAGFFVERPPLPYPIAPGAFSTAQLRFSATTPGTYSANLLLNGASILFVATVVPAPVLSIGAPCTLPEPRRVVFGNVARGTTRTCEFTLTNTSAQSLTVSTLEIAGAGFSADLPAPFTLASGQTRTFEVRFAPPAAGFFNGTLKIDAQTFQLSGAGINPPLPTPILDLESAPLASAQQRRFTLRLPEPALFDATGLVTLSFTPDSTLIAGDAAVAFAATGARTVAFSARAGSSEIQLAGQPFAVVQTGTTAGRLRFTLTSSANFASEPSAEFVIPASPPVLDDTTALRGIASISVRAVGFDNTYTAGVMTFRFFDASGRIIDAPLTADFTANFRTFFIAGFTAGASGAASQAGSAFAFSVNFPVSGDTAGIASVEMEMVNSAGTARSTRLAIR